jgi:hypothetical protein
VAEASADARRVLLAIKIDTTKTITTGDIGDVARLAVDRVVARATFGIGRIRP